MDQSRPWLGSWASCARTVGSGSAPMYLPLTYTLDAVVAAIALDREATTIAVAIASLLNIGGLRLLASRCGSHSHTDEFAATAQRLRARRWDDGFGGLELIASNACVATVMQGAGM